VPLGCVDLLDLFTEIESRRLFDTIPPVPEINLVQIQIENFVLGELLLQLLASTTSLNFLDIVFSDVSRNV